MRIYIGNLAKDINEAKLTELFAPFGKAEAVHIAVRGDGGPSRGFAFVELPDAAEAAAAMAALDGKEVNGQVLKVNEAKPKGTTTSPLVPIH
ncbi:MAG: RNA-binding protein [Thermoanaerobaculia bacterium]|nr:RNA-binding protein [Thermoanaerobaculia bacterium]